MPGKKAVDKVAFYIMGMLGKTIIGNILNIVSFQYGLRYFMLMTLLKTVVTALFLSLFNDLTEFFSYRTLIQFFSLVNVLTCSGTMICINFYKYKLKENTLYFLFVNTMFFAHSYISRIFICNEMTSLAEEKKVYEFYRAGNSLSHFLASFFSLLSFSQLNTKLDYECITIILLTYEAFLSISILFMSSFYWKLGQSIYDEKKKDSMNLKWDRENICYILYIYWEGMVTYVLYSYSAYFYGSNLLNKKTMPILLLLMYDIFDLFTKTTACFKSVTFFERECAKRKFFILFVKSIIGYTYLFIVLCQNNILLHGHAENFKSVIADIFVLGFYVTCGFGTGILDMYLTKEFLDRNEGCTKSASAYSAFADYMADFTMSAILSYYSYAHGL